MLEFLQYFERIAPRLDSVVLIVPGLLCILGGLFIWLAGLRYTKIIAALLGMLVGGTCSSFLIGRKMLPNISLALLTGFVAMLLHKYVFVILAVLIVVVGATFFLTDMDIEKNSELILYINSSDTENISAPEAAIILSRAIDYLWERTKALYADFPLLRMLAVVGLGLLAAFLAVNFSKAAGALCCATLGTILNFTGMVLLLLYKGAEPITRIGSKSIFFTSVFAIMIAVGTAVQLFFCASRYKKIPAESENEQQKTKSKYANKMRWLIR
jgi:hypothetical protein